MTIQTINYNKHQPPWTPEVASPTPKIYPEVAPGKKKYCFNKIKEHIIPFQRKKVEFHSRKKNGENWKMFNIIVLKPCFTATEFIMEDQKLVLL